MSCLITSCTGLLRSRGAVDENPERYNAVEIRHGKHILYWRGTSRSEKEGFRPPSCESIWDPVKSLIRGGPQPPRLRRSRTVTRS